MLAEYTFSDDFSRTDSYFVMCNFPIISYTKENVP